MIYLYLGSEDKGSNFYSPDGKYFHSYQSEDNVPYSISDNNILSIYQDISGIFWIAAARSINKIRNNKKFETILGADSKYPLSGKNVWAIIEDTERNL